MATSGWRYCGACRVLFWDGDTNKGRCPAGGGHRAAGFRFVLPSNLPETPVAQANWRHCGRCRGLFYNGFPGKVGRCPFGDRGHLAGDRDYLLNHDIPGTDTAQAGWRFCGKCHGVYFDGDPDKGRCPGGGGHAAVGWNFVLPHAPVTTGGYGDDYEGIPV